MYRKFTRKRERDAARFERWRGKEAELAKFGVTFDKLAAAQMGFQGTIVTPWDPEYNQLRMLSNPVFDPYPSIILMCVTEGDVGLALNLAWGGSPQTPFTVRSGGHCTAGFSAGSGFLIDVSGLNDVYIDPVALTATVQAGCNFGKLSPILDSYGLHLPIGDCSEVCVGGYMQGGGYSFSSRTYGMQCDNVLEVRVMLADGVVVTGNADRNSDLYWAVCGGTGGNFGVLLSIKYQLTSIGAVMGFSIVWPLATAQDIATAAAALQTIQANYLSTAPQPMTPQLIFVWQPISSTNSQLIPTMLYRGVYIGSQQDGLNAIAPIQQIPGAQFQYATMGPFSEINAMLLNQPYEIPPFPPNMAMPCEDKQARYVAATLSLAQWQNVLNWFVTSPNVYTAMCFEVAGGAINALPPETNAFIHRTAQFSAFLDVFWPQGSDPSPLQAFLGQFTTLFEGFWNQEIYQDYPNMNVPDYRMNYWGDAFWALLAVKAKYDPQTFFNYAQAIVPYPNQPNPAPTWPSAVVQALQQPIVPDPAQPRSRAQAPV
jgi:hypothetical protein